MNDFIFSACMIVVMAASAVLGVAFAYMTIRLFMAFMFGG